METKICNRCWQRKPATHFRRRRRNSDERHNECRECFAEYMRSYRASRRRGEFANFNRRSRDRKRGASFATAVCAEMVRRFGGVDKFASAWKAYFDAAVAARPGSRLVFQSIQAVIRLIEISSWERNRRSTVRDTRPPVQHMSDEELERELQMLIKQRESVQLD